MDLEIQSKKDLEFETVRGMFSRFCLSEEGRSAFQALELCHDTKELSMRQDTIGDFVRLISSGMISRPDAFPDLSDCFSHLDDLRYSLDGATTYRVAWYIQSASRFCAFCHGKLEDGQPLPSLVSLMGQEIDDNLLDLEREIDNTLESDGSVKESHPVIAALMRKVEEERQGRQKFIRDFINKHPEQIQSDQGALRDGRMVIAMRSDRTVRSDGFVTGTSQTGNTLFVEPFRLVEINNSVTMAQEQIEIEIARIIKALSDKVKRLKTELLNLSAMVAHADTLYALSAACHEFGMSRSELNGHGVHLLEARHLLLGEKAVPITMVLDEKIKAVVLTGPNAGGKTVTIKTVGLCAMINQLCGWIPCKEGSHLPLFDHIFTEIGDDQSIEEGLSTFSSHMRRIASIVDNMTSSSLVILDELGSGTDPVEGSALARAILEATLAKAELTLVTSHHGVLKEFAYAREDVMNASMAFDDSSHRPTFRVVQGIPGDSHALDTARAMHVDPAIIARAEQYLGSSAVQIGEVIKGLEKKRRELEAREVGIKAQEQENERKKKELEQKEWAVRETKLKLIDEQDTDLAHFMRDKNRELEKLVADLKTGEVTKEKTVKVKEYVASLKEKKTQTEAWLANEEEHIAKNTNVTYEVGEAVLCGKAKRPGVITKNLKKDGYQVAIGTMKLTLKAKDLQKANEKPGVQVQVSYTGESAAPVMVMDVRGLTLEETLHRLDLQIESALVHGLSTFSIIHGYGDGILSKGIGDYLKHHPAVKDYRFALPEDGGMGKTYVML